MKKYRMMKFSAVALTCLFLTLAMAPQQAPVVLYKLGLILSGAWAFWWLDMLAFPYGRPGGYLTTPWDGTIITALDDADYKVVRGYESVFAWACMRRAVLMSVGGALGMSLGV